MSYLLDTHAFLWWITDSDRLSLRARDVIGAAQSSLFWSVASSWESGIKYALGRLPLPSAPEGYLPRQLRTNRVSVVAIQDAHAYRAAALPDHHADPFDRMLIAQAQLEGFTLISGDARMRDYEVELVW